MTLYILQTFVSFNCCQLGWWKHHLSQTGLVLSWVAQSLIIVITVNGTLGIHRLNWQVWTLRENQKQMVASPAKLSRLARRAQIKLHRVVSILGAVSYIYVMLCLQLYWHLQYQDLDGYALFPNWHRWHSLQMTEIHTNTVCATQSRASLALYQHTFQRSFFRHLHLLFPAVVAIFHLIFSVVIQIDFALF